MEFKSARQGKPGSQTKRPVKDILKNIAETLIAFANAEGGVLYLGVEDDKTISGIHHGENEIAELKTGFIKLIQNSRDFPLQSAYSFQVDGKVVLTYEIKNIRLQPFQLTDGRCLKRINDESRPYSAVRIIQSKEEDESKDFDRQYCNNATEKDIDWERVEEVGARCYPGISAKDFLNIQNLAEYGPGKMLFRNACLLLFGLKERIPYLFPKSSIRLIRVDGHKLLPGNEYNVLRQDEFMGNIFYLKRIWNKQFTPCTRTTSPGPRTSLESSSKAVFTELRKRI